MTIIIRCIQPRDESGWRNLWAGYNRFYEHEAAEAVTRSVWSRILDSASPIHAIVAEAADGAIVGMANYVLHDGTWSIEPACCLEDLYVDPRRRGNGVGRMLIDWLVSEMKANRWAKLYWVTRENNYRARALYDTYTPHSGFLRYAISNDADEAS
jgi:GNAT superfamily N-acetyltransferase